MSMDFGLGRYKKAQQLASSTHNSTWGGVHKGDAKTQPKMASSFQNDKSVQSGEFESAAAPSTADTGIHGKPVQQTQSGEFESTPKPRYSDH